MNFTKISIEELSVSQDQNAVILIRHGESKWNALSQFTGWANIGLTEKGIKQAEEAGKLFKSINLDIAFTSVLTRAKKTLDIFLKHAEQETININSDWALNERDYGDLTGKNKNQLKDEVGEEQFLIWRRSYDTPPPGGESLKDTENRSWPYFEKQIVPFLHDNKKVIISAHGNSLRAIVKNLEKISESQISELEIPHVVPWIYRLENV